MCIVLFEKVRVIQLVIILPPPVEYESCRFYKSVCLSLSLPTVSYLNHLNLNPILHLIDFEIRFNIIPLL